MAKRLFDLSITALGLILLAPVFLLLAILIRIRMGCPVVYRQKRPGIHGEPFTVLKFRTMADIRDERGVLLADSERVTGLGRFLRSASLDELPGLWNVLKGDMSLVGPRPLLMEYLSYYTPDQARRHDVRPGLTGWAQINGRNAITWEEKFALDVWYIQNRSMMLDIRILLRTLSTVLKRRGISGAGEVTVRKFTGNLF